MRLALAIVLAAAIFTFSCGWDGDWDDFSIPGLFVANLVIAGGTWLQLRHKGDL